MDQVPLNNSPDLSMDEITKQLFNNEFMSDIQFHIGGKVIYAHSWEVMKRSIVFWQQFRTNLGENKLITIDDVSYEAFYQFMRFIYTDEFRVEDKIICDILKLAVRYKVVKLEGKVLDVGANTNTTTDLQFFQFGMLNKYEVCIPTALNNILKFMEAVDFATTAFLNIHQSVLEEILEIETACQQISEVELFDGLMLWMNHTCAKNQISTAQRRSRFDKLIQLIRFPAMKIDEFFMCLKNHRDLLTNDDIGIIVKQMAIGSTDKNQIWITKARQEYQHFANFRKFPFDTNWETKFTVSDNLILQGVQYGVSKNVTNYGIQISSRNPTTNVADSLNFKLNGIYQTQTICLGESIKLSPNFEYSIEIIFEPSLQEIVTEKEYNIYCRAPNMNTIISGPSDLVTFLETSANLLEMHFKTPSK